MEISLRTAFHSIQALLLELKELDKNKEENANEDWLMMENIDTALSELEEAYTGYIREHHISNYPSYEKLYTTIMKQS